MFKLQNFFLLSVGMQSYIATIDFNFSYIIVFRHLCCSFPMMPGHGIFVLPPKDGVICGQWDDIKVGLWGIFPQRTNYSDRGE